MKKEYTFDVDFNERIEDLWQTAICRYLNDDQYKYFKDTKKELVNEFKSIINEIERTAKSNSIKYMEANLKRYVNDYKLKTLSDLDAVIEATYKGITGPGDWACYQNELELKDFCAKYPEIAKNYLEIDSINYSELISAFKQPETKDIEFWKKVVKIERSIPRYDNKFTWWERTINFINTHIVEHAVEGQSVSIAGLWDITLDLNIKDDHETLHSSRDKCYAAFYHVPSGERTELKIVANIESGLSKYCYDTILPHNADSVLFYCLDTAEYYLATKLHVEPKLDQKYYIYNNRLHEPVLYYKVNLSRPTLFAYNKPLPDLVEQKILSDLSSYKYLERNV